MGLLLPGESMVCRLVSKLTVIALAAHLLVGCCWHHAHACGHGRAWGGSGDVATADRHEDHCGHEGHCADEPAGPDRHGRDDCEGGRCVFTSDRSTRASGASAAQFRQAPPDALTVRDGLPAESNLRATALAVPGYRPPLPAHLLLQVLLL
jgi:hypothetical protein